MDSRKQKYVIIGILCLVVVGLSIGYAALSANLKIGGTATIPSEKWSVIFVSENTTTSKGGKAECNIGTVSGTSITGLSASFKVPGDSCTFTIPVENAGTIAAKLKDVDGKNSPLTYKGTTPDDENILKGNVTYEVTYGNTEINNETDFTNIDILDSKEKTTITLKITFKAEAKDIPKESVTIGGLDRTFVFENVINGEGSSSGTVTPVSQPNAPELSDGMIPVYYEENGTKDGVWKKADESNEDNSWYDYDHQKWANAVTVTSDVRNDIIQAAPGTEIDMDKINTMWVWIPRYSYTIQGKYGRGGTSAELPGAIDIKFLSETDPIDAGIAKYTGSKPEEWRTPDAFNFGETTQAGIWVGKFETAGSLKTNAQACTDELCDVSKLSIKPGISSLRTQKVSSLFYAARSMQKDATTFGFTDSGDLHMMKNDEWGAVAYLSQSKYGKHGNPDYAGKYEEIYQNKSSEYKTGSSNGTPSQSDATQTQYVYNDMTKLGEGQGQAGPGASTTGNIYGIYDMSGGAWEYVMGVLAYFEDPYPPMSGNSAVNNSGFTGKVYNSNNYSNFTNEPALSFPEEKYYNLYKVSTTKDGMPTSSNLSYSVNACNGRICYGQALSETSGWYSDWAGFVYCEAPWSARGGYYSSNSTDAGVFRSHNAYGVASGDYGSRFVFTP